MSKQYPLTVSLESPSFGPCANNSSLDMPLWLWIVWVPIQRFLAEQINRRKTTDHIQTLIWGFLLCLRNEIRLCAKWYDFGCNFCFAPLTCRTGRGEKTSYTQNCTVSISVLAVVANEVETAITWHCNSREAVGRRNPLRAPRFSHLLKILISPSLSLCLSAYIYI